MTRRQVFGSLLGAAVAAPLFGMRYVPASKSQFTVDKDHPFFMHVRLSDQLGKLIPLAFSWDAAQSIAKIYITTGERRGVHNVAVGRINEKNQVLTATVEMPGCYLIWSDTLKRVTLAEIQSGVRA